MVPDELQIRASTQKEGPGEPGPSRVSQATDARPYGVTVRFSGIARLGVTGSLLCTQTLAL